MIGQTISHFRILARIGGGGMGTVFKAEDTRLPGRIVALKLLNPELVGDAQLKKRFLLEAQTATSLDHPNICEIFEVDETNEGRLFMSMRYYGGASLRHRLAEAPLDPLEAFQIAYSIAQGLHAAHRRDIIHRDIKPANIMVTEDGYVKIVDFGLAKLLGRTRVTATGITVGTAAYMSPEQADGSDVDGRTDIWSLGVVLYEMVTGRLPFRGEIDQAMIYSILNEDATPVHEVNPSVPEACARVIEKCLAKDPDKRYASTGELLEDMHRTSETLGWGSDLSMATVAPVSWVAHRVDARRKKQRIVSGVITAAVIVAAALIYMYFNRDDSPYVTDVRLAVMPFQSRIGPDYDAIAAGLSYVTSDALDDCAQHSKSMWVVPYHFVTWVDPPGPREAGRAFGVNYVLTGEIQRFETSPRLTVSVRDPETEAAVWTTAIDFNEETLATVGLRLRDELTEYFGAEDSPGESELDFITPGIARRYLSARGVLTEAPESSVVWLGDVCAAAPGFALARTFLGWARFQTFRTTHNTAEIARSLEEMRDARALAPHSAWTHYYIGETFRQLAGRDSAATCLGDAMVRAPGAHLPRRALARTYRDQDRLDEAEAVLLDAIEMRPDFYSDFKELGIMNYRVARYDTAIRWLQQAILLAPEDVSSLNALGACYHATGKFQEAATMWERAFRLSPNCDNCNNVGLMHYYAGHYQDAANYYETALSYCDSTDYTAWGNLGISLYWVDSARDRALEALARATRLAEAKLPTLPGDIEIMTDLISYYSMRGMEEETLTAITRAEHYARNDAHVLFEIGGAYEVLGDRGKALEYIGEALRRDYPAEAATREPALRELVEDARFQQMLTSQVNN